MATDRHQPRERPTSLVPPWLLLLLSRESGHGYALHRRLVEQGLRADRGQVYRALRRLEAAGLVKADRTASPEGPNRRVYKLTRKGRRTLDGNARDIAEAADALNAFVTAYASRPARRR